MIRFVGLFCPQGAIEHNVQQSYDALKKGLILKKNLIILQVGV